MTGDIFFEESSEESEVKRTIVAKYFSAWAKVIIPHAKKHSGKIAYIDLFAGPGRYKDGTTSTPLMVLEKAIANPDMRQMLISIFNDKNADNSNSLDKAIREIPRVETLRYRPRVDNYEVGEEIVQEFSEHNLVPTLFFVDPWGYKGLSLRLVNSVLKDWGCDCIFFFNYNRINMGLTNVKVVEHMNALFGVKRADYLRSILPSLTPEQRELTIVEELSTSLREYGGKYVLPFRFRNSAGTRTSHYLFFVSKNFRGYEIMKEIMAKESSKTEQGVASFEYCQTDSRQPFLFALNSPLDQLENMLLSDFAGKTVSMNDIYLSHNVGKRYIKRNYKEALLSMERKGAITCDPPMDKRRKRKEVPTFSDKVMVTFQARENG